MDMCSKSSKVKPWTLTGTIVHNFSLFLKLVLILFQISSQTQFRSLVKTSGWAYPCFVWYSTTGTDFFPST